MDVLDGVVAALERVPQDLPQPPGGLKDVPLCGVDACVNFICGWPRQGRGGMPSSVRSGFPTGISV